MNLSFWRIKVREGKTSGNIFADVETAQGQNAAIHFYKGFWKLPPDEQRETVCHELCHLILDPVSTLTDELRAGMKRSAYALFLRCFEAVGEGPVEAFARLIAPTLPLPPDFRAISR